MSLRIGSGFDIHRLQDNIPLYVGGILIPHTKGSLGHSDGDVLIHALCDAILGALNLGDLGAYFPSTDPSLKGIKSSIILERIIGEMKAKNAQLINIDATIFLQRPRLAEHIQKMKTCLTPLCETEENRISIKSKSTDFLGAIGEGNAIGAACSVLLEVSP